MTSKVKKKKKKRKKKLFKRERYFFGTETHDNSRSAVSRSAGSLCGEPRLIHRRAQLPTACLPRWLRCTALGSPGSGGQGGAFLFKSSTGDRDWLLAMQVFLPGSLRGLPPPPLYRLCFHALSPSSSAPLPPLALAPSSLQPSSARQRHGRHASNRCRAPRCASLGHAERLRNREGTRGAPGRRDGRC